MTKTVKTAKAKAAAAPQEPVAKEVAERDRFNCRLESQAATINAAITSKPKTAAAIATETELNAGRVRSHLKFLVEKGFIVASDEGYAAKPAKAKK
jgi:predicted Rossmann fold nucleotide-binding protein DprA/Smf involved in DNA uptake